MLFPPTNIPNEIHFQVLASSNKPVFPTIGYRFSTEKTKKTQQNQFWYFSSSAKKILKNKT